MTVRFDAAADRLVRTANLLDQNAAYTVMFWFRPVAVSTGTGQTLFAISAGTYNANGDQVYLRSSAANLALYEVAGASNQQQNGATTIVANTWYHVTVVRASATSAQMYLDGTAEGAANTLDVSGRTAAARQEIGGWAATNNEPFNGRIAYIKIWTAALSAAEIAGEINAIPPRRTSDLYAWYPTFAGTGTRNLDYGASGYDWTESGTLTDEDPPSGPYWNELEGFRFRNDDGNETAATWLAAQDASITQPAGANIRLRTVINAVSGSAAAAYQLEYRKQGETAWKKVTARP